MFYLHVSEKLLFFENTNNAKSFNNVSVVNKRQNVDNINKLAFKLFVVSDKNV